MNSTITRRSFLGKLARTGARAAAYTVGGPMLLRQATGIDIPSRLHRAMQTQGVLTDDLTPEEQAKILEWGAIDYRNVCTAIGVEAALTKYQSEIPEDKIIPIFEGDNHSDTMNYLVDPALRQKKNLAYAPMNLLGNRTVRRFHFDSESESWSLVDSFNY